MKENFNDYEKPNKNMCNWSGCLTHPSKFIWLCILFLARIIFDGFKDLSKTIKNKKT